MICCRNNFQEIHLDILLHFSNLDRFYRHTSKKSEVELLVVGRGGDQLGLEISYKLEPDGDLRDENNYKITQLEASETKQLYAMAAALADEQVHQTINIYNFVRIIRPKDTSRWVWAEGENKVPPEVVELHSQLMNRASAQLP